MSVFPGKRGLPRRSSANIHPADQTSTDVPYFVAPKSSSGGLYQSVITLFVKSRLLLSETRPNARLYLFVFVQ